MRDIFQGLTRFDEFTRSLGIAPNILTRRLKALTEAGLLEKRAYSAHPPRFGYHLTERGLDFYPVLIAIFRWGNCHLMPDGAAFELQHRRTGETIDPILVDRNSLQPISLDNTRLAPGPAVTPAALERLDIIKRLHARENALQATASTGESAL